jgi:hypothetical protein
MALWDLHEGAPSHWLFVIDTDEYAGGVERDMSAFIVGQCDLCHSGIGDCEEDSYHQLYNEELPKNPFENLVGSIVDDHGDDQINRSPQILVATPGYSNNGHGEVKKLSPGETLEHPAYNSIGIALEREPTEEELDLLCERTLKFSSLPKDKDWDARPKILGFRLLEYKTTFKTLWRDTDKVIWESRE